MLFAFLTFCLVVVVVLGSYWALVLRQEQAEESKVRRRLRSAAAGLKASVVSVSREREKLSDIPLLDAALARSRTLADRAQDLVDRSGMKVTVGAVFLAAACLAALGFEGSLLLGTGWLVAPIVGAGLGGLPFLFLRYKARKRSERFEELFPEAIGLMVRALRAGHAFTTGVAMAAEEMADPVGPELKKLYEQQNYGMPVEDALRDLAVRVPLLDVRFFVTAVLTQRQSGGNLAEILENLIAVIRDRFKVKRQVRVVTAHARITGFVLMLLPIACAIIMLVIAPDHMRVLWTDPMGIRMLYAGIILQILGVIAIRRIVRIEY
jgi:tight adherence protein B